MMDYCLIRDCVTGIFWCVLYGLGILAVLFLLAECEDKEPEEPTVITAQKDGFVLGQTIEWPITRPRTHSRVVATESGSYATGSFASDGISPSVTARRACGLRTSGSWAGWVLVEYYVPDQGWMLKDVDWSVWSSYNANMIFETFTPDRYRFRMVGYTGGRCDYQLIGS